MAVVISERFSLLGKPVTQDAGSVIQLCAVLISMNRKCFPFIAGATNLYHWKYLRI